MKKEVSKPAMFGAIAVVLALLVFVFIKFGTGSAPEFEPPKNVGKVIPRYVWDTMDPTVRSKMEAQGYKPGDVDPAASQPSTAPNGAPIGGPQEPK